jgi:hypothetical protein
VSPHFFPYTKHRVFNKNLQVTFQNEHEVLVKSRPDYRTVYDEFTTMTYTFTHESYLTQFQEDLRAKKLVVSVDVSRFYTNRYREPEAEREKVLLWKDDQREEVSLHSITFFANKFEQRELEFPLLWFNRHIIKESGSSLQLTFSAEDVWPRERKHSRSSSIQSGELVLSLGHYLLESVANSRADQHLSPSLNSNSSQVSIRNSPQIPDGLKTWLAALGFLKLTFGTREGKS